MVRVAEKVMMQTMFGMPLFTPVPVAFPAFPYP
jgi:hypothetical protein